MKRKRNKVFLGLALAGVATVAGFTLATTKESQAEVNDGVGGITLSSLVNTISGESNIPNERVLESLNTKKLFVRTSNRGLLEQNPSIVNIKEYFGEFYVVEYATALDAAIGFQELKNNDEIDGVSLNMKLETERYQFTHGDSAYKAWGTSTTKLDSYSDEISESCTEPFNIAVIDTGINENHVIFSESTAKDRINTTYGYDFKDDDNTPNDEDGHGTMVSSIISQTTPRCAKILPVKVNLDEPVTLLDALEYIAYGDSDNDGDRDFSVRVANISLGADVDPTFQQDVDDIIKKVVNDYNVIVVAAAGNDPREEIKYPASVDESITVTAVDRTNTLAAFSSFGDKVDFAAPGVDLYVAKHDVNDGYLSENGTSFSAPYITAAVADILIEHPGYTYQDVYDDLRLNANDLGDAGWDNKYGWGSVSFRINKYADIGGLSTTAPTNWTNDKVQVTTRTTTTDSNIIKTKVVAGASKIPPAEWESGNISRVALASGFQFDVHNQITENGTYTIWLKNDKGEIKYHRITVNIIDKDAPEIKKNIKAVVVDENNFTLSVEVKEPDSGLKKIEWYYKAEDDEEYTDETDTYNEAGNSSVVTKSHDFEVSEGGNYTAYAKVYDRAGNCTTLEAIEFLVSDDGGEFGGDDRVITLPDASSDDAVTNPKTKDDGLMKISASAITFVLAGTIIFVRRRR